jgi:hypothetical protein
MKRQNGCVVAILALALVAMGQEPREERVEARVVGPVGGISSIEPVEVDLEDLDLDGGVGSLILGVEGAPQDADQKGEVRHKLRMSPQDAGKDGTIVKEIDLGDGKTMKIIISTGKAGGKPLTKSWVGSMQEHFPEGFKGMKVFGPEGVQISPHDFHFEAFGGEMKGQMDRALRAFDRAREEFIRAYKEGDKGLKEKKPAIATPRVRVAKPLERGHGGRVFIGKGESDEDQAEKAQKADEAHAKMVEGIKSRLEQELKKTEAEARDKQVSKMKEELRAKRPAVQFVDTAPGASTKGEIEALRKEIKELEKMVRELRDELQKN